MNPCPTASSPAALGGFDRRRFLALGAGALAAQASPRAWAATPPPGGEITGWTATRLSQAIAGREVSCVEVMTAYLDQIERLNPKVNAIVSLQPRDGLLRQARERDRQLQRGERLGWMHGFPLAPKDLASTAGIPTTLGSPILRNHVPKTDAIVVERMRRAGAILVGKTNTPEFGLGSHTYNPVFGTTLNAFDPGRSAGGSSGGAAAALALRLLPVADGSDMMGSLRNPAGWNNVFGLRPSQGRVPFGPTGEVFMQQLGYEGPMGRSVADVAMLLSVQAGADARTPLALEQDPALFTGSLQRGFKSVRIGWLGDYGSYLPTEPGVMDTCRQALRHFQSIGCTVEAAQPAFDMSRLWNAWVMLRSFLVAGGLGGFYADPKLRAQLKPEAVWEIERGRQLSGADVYTASADRSAWYAALGELFQRFDFLVLPTAQVFPFDARLAWPRAIAGRAMDTYHRWMEVVIGGSMAGVPVLNVPAGFSADGLPMGLQVMGRPRDDLSVLQLGHAYEQVCGYTQRHSPLLG